MGRRDVGIILAKVRDIALKRKHISWLRWRDDLSPRTQPPPNLPKGVNQKLSGNYYFTRDARREVSAPLLLMDAGAPKTLKSGKGKEPSNTVCRTPGPVYCWDH